MADIFNATNASIGTSPVSLNVIHYVAIVLYFTFGVITVLENLVLLLAMHRAKLLEMGGILIAHYAVADILTGLLNVFYLPWSILYQDQFMPAYIPGFLLGYVEYSRKMFIAFMAATRFYVIVYPFSARRVMSRLWYTKSAFITWFVSAIVCIPYWTCACLYFDPARCKWSWRTDTRYWTSKYGAIINSLVTIVILCTYPVCFYKLIRNKNIRNQKLSPNRKNDAPHRPFVFHREQTLLYLFAFNSLVYMLFWIPIYLFELWRVSITYNYGLYQETMRSILISYYPIAYCIFNRNIRLAVNNLFKRRKSSTDSQIRVLCK